MSMDQGGSPRALTWMACALGLLASACGPAAEPYDAPTPSPGAQETYDRFCLACHGPDGRMVAEVTNPVWISNPAFLESVSDEYLRASIAHGRPGSNGRGMPGSKMSAFGEGDPPALSAEEIDSLVGLMRSWQDRPTIALEPFEMSGDATSGGVLYQERCAACHGPDGWGELGPRLAGSTFQASASDAYIRHVILEGRRGTTMPAYDLDDVEIANLIAFIRELGAPTE